MKNIEQTEFNKIFNGIIGFYQFIDLNDIYLVFTRFYKDLTKEEFDVLVKNTQTQKNLQMFGMSKYFSDGLMDNVSVMNCVQNYDQLPLYMLEKAHDYVNYDNEQVDYHVAGSKETMDLVNFLSKLNPKANAFELVCQEIIDIDSAQSLEKTLQVFSKRLIDNGYKFNSLNELLEFNKLLNNLYANVRLPSNKGWTFKELKHMGYKIPGLTGYDYLSNKNVLMNIWNISSI